MLDHSIHCHAVAAASRAQVYFERRSSWISRSAYDSKKSSSSFSLSLASMSSVHTQLHWEKWEVLRGIRLLGTTCCCGLSNHQAATAQMHLVEKYIVECPPHLRSTSPFADTHEASTTTRTTRTRITTTMATSATTMATTTATTPTPRPTPSSGRRPVSLDPSSDTPGFQISYTIKLLTQQLEGQKVAFRWPAPTPTPTYAHYNNWRPSSENTTRIPTLRQPSQGGLTIMSTT